MRPFEILPRRIPAAFADRIGRGVASLGVTANMVSLAGFAGNVAAGFLVASDRLLLAGIVFLVFSALDFVDGAVARATGTASPFGAVFDAVLDRLGEAAILIGMVWYFGDRGEYLQAGATFWALFGSVAVSYTRARAEVMGLEMREGLFRRQERVVLLSLGLVFNALAIVAWALAILANLTALQRFWLIARALRGQREDGPRG